MPQVQVDLIQISIEGNTLYKLYCTRCNTCRSIDCIERFHWHWISVWNWTTTHVFQRFQFAMHNIMWKFLCFGSLSADDFMMTYHFNIHFAWFRLNWEHLRKFMFILKIMHQSSSIIQRLRKSIHFRFLKHF